MTRLVCLACSNTCSMDEMLKAPSPFDPEDTVVGCPACKEVNAFQTGCDILGCPEPVVYGRETPAGYLTTCAKHTL